MSFFDLNIVISPSDIKLGEDFGFTKSANDVSDKGKGIPIFDGVFC